MVDVFLRVLPSGDELLLALPGVPRAGDWLETEAGILVADVVMFRAGGRVLVVGHAVAAGLVAERLDPAPAKADEAFALRG